jgi:uncharacterized protein YndB with AHSA1/START domain
LEILNTTPEREISSQRVFNFPIELVYKAFADPNHLKNWWGPKGFTNTFNLFEFKPGGKWSFIMHGPEKGNYENECVFIVIEENKLLIWDHLPNPKFYVIVQFTEVEKTKTQIIFRQLFDSVELRDKILKYTEGKNDENFDRLEEVLKEMKKDYL